MCQRFANQLQALGFPALERLVGDVSLMELWGNDFVRVQPFGNTGVTIFGLLPFRVVIHEKVIFCFIEPAYHHRSDGRGRALHRR